MKHSILVALKDSMNSRAVVDYLAMLPFDRERCEITLLHVFRKPSASEALMGESFSKEEHDRLMGVMEEAVSRLTEAGIRPEQIEIKMAKAVPPSPTIADMIIEQLKQKKYTLAVIGRRKKSKSEEFVLGDVSVKLVRAMEKTAVLVVKS